MRIEDTGGNVTYTIDDCDCGLTGGCWKCQPIYIPAYNNETIIERQKFYEPATIPTMVRSFRR